MKIKFAQNEHNIQYKLSMYTSSINKPKISNVSENWEGSLSETLSHSNVSDQKALLDEQSKNKCAVVSISTSQKVQLLWSLLKSISMKFKEEIQK